MRRALIALPLALALVACDDEPVGSDSDSDSDADGDTDSDTDSDTDTDTDTDFREVVVDATSRDALATLDLRTGQAASRTWTEARQATDWQLALQRVSVWSRGGDTVEGPVLVGLAVPQDDFYTQDGEPVADVFTSATPDDELDHLLDAVPEPEALLADAIDDVMGSDWYVYSPSDGHVSGNDTVGYVIRTGEGDGAARFRVTHVDFPTRSGEGIKSFQATFELEAEGGLAAPVTWSTSLAGGAVCFDADVGAEVGCDTAVWDVQLYFEGRSFGLRTNSGQAGPGAGGAAGPFAWEELATWDRASVDPEGGEVSLAIEHAVSTFESESWWAYGLQGAHRVWPNYRVYVVDDGAERWAVQLVGYYGTGGDGASGEVVVRWRELP